MEKDWRKRFEEWFYRKYTGNKTYYWIDISYNDVDNMYKELEGFIEQEIEKAREEVLREVLDKSRDLSMLHLNPHIRTSDVEEMLSKLTTK